MLNLSGKKAQFFILTTVVIVGVFYTLSKYINPYAFIDTSRAASGSETFFFDNVKEKAIKTVQISNETELETNLNQYKNFVEKMASDKGYSLSFGYVVQTSTVDFNMILTSERMTLKADFTEGRP
ncbi:MAG: hypothetical protein Q6356_009775 [Candidatus Wukongarchaeota archaeon]|nr:hypothetical protein [Candidatus Wukongarchaeota archaeon]